MLTYTTSANNNMEFLRVTNDVDVQGDLEKVAAYLPKRPKRRSYPVLVLVRYVSSGAIGPSVHPSHIHVD